MFVCEVQPVGEVLFGTDGVVFLRSIEWGHQSVVVWMKEEYGGLTRNETPGIIQLRKQYSMFLFEEEKERNSTTKESKSVSLSINDC